MTSLPECVSRKRTFVEDASNSDGGDAQDDGTAIAGGGGGQDDGTATASGDDPRFVPVDELPPAVTSQDMWSWDSQPDPEVVAPAAAPPEAEAEDAEPLGAQRFPRWRPGTDVRDILPCDLPATKAEDESDDEASSAPPGFHVVRDCRHA